MTTGFAALPEDAWASASIRIFSEAALPAGVPERFGLRVPTRPNSARTSKHYALKRSPLPKNVSLEQHVVALLDGWVPLRDLLGTIDQPWEADMVWAIGAETAQQEFLITPRTAVRLDADRWDVVIDYYCPHNEGREGRPAVKQHAVGLYSAQGNLLVERVLPQGLEVVSPASLEPLQIPQSVGLFFRLSVGSTNGQGSIGIDNRLFHTLSGYGASLQLVVLDGDSHSRIHTIGG